MSYGIRFVEDESGVGTFEAIGLLAVACVLVFAIVRLTGGTKDSASKAENALNDAMRKIPT